MNYLAILGRQPELSLAELECQYGANSLTPFSPTSAIVETDRLDAQTFGGVVKAAKVIDRFHARDFAAVQKKVVGLYARAWSNLDHKQTVGISIYDWNVPTREIQKCGLQLKSALKKSGVSLRLIPNQDSALNTATSHHNKLGLSKNKTELIIVKNSKNEVILSESVGAQNITALALRDQGRPKRDAFVGMLPPKLALMMVNMVALDHGRILDPFCGTGVILQEALLRGYDVYGTDLAEKMIDFSRQNIDWLQKTHYAPGLAEIHHGDAIETKWQQPIDAIVSETYLGQPFNALPAPDKLDKVRRICDHIISKFLENLAPQLKSGTPLCLAVPAWRDSSGELSHLSLLTSLEKLGYERLQLHHVDTQRLAYFREDQIVARQILLLMRK